MYLVSESSGGSVALNGRLVLLNQSFFSGTKLPHTYLGTFKSVQSISLHKGWDPPGTSAHSSGAVVSMAPHPAPDLLCSSWAPLPAHRPPWQWKAPPELCQSPTEHRTGPSFPFSFRFWITHCWFEQTRGTSFTRSLSQGYGADKAPFPVCLCSTA